MFRIRMAALLWLAASPAMAEGVAIFPPKLLDTSHEARDQSADHQRRLDLLAGILSESLTPSVIIRSGQVASACSPETTGCLLALARDSQADRSLFVVVQKTSTLIMQIFTTLVDTSSGELIASPSLNFRGDTDEAWRRAGRFLARDLKDDL
ncbi:DUF2380 domain-containing protein [Paracoccus beibuensis]|uniref:DUF2380 domain-containing protein n=1 Tax=Paracoccus beibuensis TaxID=547602 RepID=UPI0022401F2B|nr:DUF2380 domain-containing protein [Paracoccus beibuensis]